MTPEEFWTKDYHLRDRRILSDFHDKMNFAEAYHKAKIEWLRKKLLEQ